LQKQTLKISGTEFAGQLAKQEFANKKGALAVEQGSVVRHYPLQRKVPVVHEVHYVNKGPLQVRQLGSQLVSTPPRPTCTHCPFIT